MTVPHHSHKNLLYNYQYNYGDTNHSVDTNTTVAAQITHIYTSSANINNIWTAQGGQMIWSSIHLRFKWFCCQSMCASNDFGCLLIRTSSEVVVNWFEIQLIWLSSIWDSNDLVFNRFEIQVIWFSIEDVSQTCFVFDLQSFIFEGSLAEKLCFGASKLQFLRKSRRIAWFWSFKVSFFLRKSRRNALFRSFKVLIFEGSLAERLRFASQFQLWRKSRTKASFWASKLQLWRKTRRNALFLIFKASFLKEVLQKSFVFELHSFNFEGSLAEKLRFWASQLQFWRKSRRKPSLDKKLNHTSVDNQLTWTSNHLTTKSLESQINCLKIKKWQARVY